MSRSNSALETYGVPYIDYSLSLLILASSWSNRKGQEKLQFNNPNGELLRTASLPHHLIQWIAHGLDDNLGHQGGVVPSRPGGDCQFKRDRETTANLLDDR